MTECERLEKEISKLMKPCPFCGFEAGIEGCESGGMKATCLNLDCGAALPCWLPFEKNGNALEKVAMAIEYWNLRK